MSTKAVLWNPFLTLAPTTPTASTDKKPAKATDASYIKQEYHRERSVKVKVNNNTGQPVQFEGDLKISDGIAQRVSTSVPPGVHEVEVLDSPGKFLSGHHFTRELTADLTWKVSSTKGTIISEGQASVDIKPLKKSPADHARDLAQLRLGQKSHRQASIDDFIKNRLTARDYGKFLVASPEVKEGIRQAARDLKKAEETRGSVEKSIKAANGRLMLPYDINFETNTVKAQLSYRRIGEQGANFEDLLISSGEKVDQAWATLNGATTKL